jgi:hypothetical protein
VGLRKPDTIITGIITTGTIIVATPSRATGTIIALVFRGEVPTGSQLVKPFEASALIDVRKRFAMLTAIRRASSSAGSAAARQIEVDRIMSKLRFRRRLHRLRSMWGLRLRNLLRSLRNLASSDAPPASDNAPATPNTVTAFVRPFRFEFRLPCDMVEGSRFTPRAQQHINRPTRRLLLR